MEFIFELLFELIFEGCLEASTNKKVPMFIRIILAILVTTLLLGVSGGIIVLGFLIRDKNILGCIFIVSLGFILLVSSIKKIRNLYFERHSTKENP